MNPPSLGTFNRENYERFFEVDGASYLLATMYIDIYRDLDSLILNDKGILSVYLRRSRTESARKEGLTFITNSAEFRSFCTKFSKALNNWETYFINFLSNSFIQSDQLSVFFSVAKEFFSYYRKTEFFFTDYAYEYSQTHHQSLQDNLKILEEVKTQGRIMLIRFFNGSGSFLHRALRKLSEQTNIDVAELYKHSGEELTHLLLGLPVEQRILDQRVKNYVIANCDSDVCFLTGKQFEAVIQTYADISDGVISGTVANPGFVEGVARVIDANFNNFDQLVEMIDEMMEGEILIAETTSPDLMIACQKASAIVTNQGGLGSHAAVLSRELRIPCIVGTQNATKLVKSGNIVQVDANNGLVRILA